MVSNVAQTKKGSSKRVAGFDVIKAFAMFLVVYIHYTFYTSMYPITSISQALSSATTMGVPLFLMVNGALVLSKPLDYKRDLSRLLHIVWLTIAWKVISAAILGLIIGVSPLKDGIRSFISYVLFGSLEGFNLGHFWYLYALVFIYLLVPLLKAAISTDQSTLVIDGLIITIVSLVFVHQAVTSIQFYLNDRFSTPVIDTGGLHHINPFGEYGYALCYFLLGYRLKMLRSRVNNVPKKGLLIRYLLVFVVSWAALIIEQHYQQHAYGVTFYVKDGYTNILVLVMSSTIFMAALEIEELPSILMIPIRVSGSHTLGVYLLHMFVLTLEGSLIAPYTGRLESLIVNLIIILLTYMVCLLVTLVLEGVPIIKKTLF